jgi:hypothetical protein
MRTVAAVTREGLVRAWAARRLVLVVWLIHLALAAAAVFPFWWTLGSVLGPLPEADVLRTGIVPGVLTDLAELRPGLLGAFGFTLVAVVVLGLLLGAAVTGGVLEVLRGGDERPLGHRFGRGAGRFFGRFVRLSVVVGICAAIVGGLAVLPFLLLARASLREGWEPGRLAPLGGVAAAGLVTLLALLVLDASRIHIVRSDRGVLSGFRAGIGLVWRHPRAWAGTWLVNATLVGLAVALFVLFRQAVPTDRDVLVLAMVLAQQTLVVVRTGLRVALLASESALVERLRPMAAPGVDAPAPPQPDSSSAAPAAV